MVAEIIVHGGSKEGKVFSMESVLSCIVDGVVAILISKDQGEAPSVAGLISSFFHVRYMHDHHTPRTPADLI